MEQNIDMTMSLEIGCEDTVKRLNGFKRYTVQYTLKSDPKILWIEGSPGSPNLFRNFTSRLGGRAGWRWAGGGKTVAGALKRNEGPQLWRDSQLLVMMKYDEIIYNMINDGVVSSKLGSVLSSSTQVNVFEFFLRKMASLRFQYGCCVDGKSSEFNAFQRPRVNTQQALTGTC